MTRFSPDVTAQAFEMAGKLLTLHAGSAARCIPFAERARTEADWIVGIKPVSDDSTVHADYWERHPRGEEVLCLLEGQVEITLSCENGPERSVLLHAGQAFIVPRGYWHRLRVGQAGKLMFITPSQGSEHRRVVNTDTEAKS